MKHFSAVLHDIAHTLIRFDTPKEFAGRRDALVAEIVKLEGAVLRRKRQYRERDERRADATSTVEVGG